MESRRSKIVRVSSRGTSAPEEGFSPRALQIMLECGLLELAGTSDVHAAWMRYFSPRDTIGFKVNCLGGRSMCTHPALAEAAAKSLGSAGIAPHQIIAWDRHTRELERCGFSVNPGQGGAYRCFGTDQKGAGYEEELTAQGSVGSLFSTLLTRHCTSVINMPILKDHGLCGLTCALKNIFGALHNPNKYHDDHCDPYIADANAVPFVREKLRLVVCDALQVQYKGGPSYHRKWVADLGSLLLAEDPVALDTVCAGLLNKIRRENGLPPIVEDGELPAYIRTAADSDHKLGRCRPEEIELVEKIVDLEG
ncbi:MAG: DUF362 domain-containing protein [bacterium]